MSISVDDLEKAGVDTQGLPVLGCRYDVKTGEVQVVVAVESA